MRPVLPHFCTNRKREIQLGERLKPISTVHLHSTVKMTREPLFYRETGTKQRSSVVAKHKNFVSRKFHYLRRIYIQGRPCNHLIVAGVSCIQPTSTSHLSGGYFEAKIVISLE